IHITADRIAIDNSSTIAGNGGRIVLAPFSAGQAINLGTATDNIFELSSSELNTLQTTGVAQIGSSTAGAIAVQGAVSVDQAGTTVGTFDLETAAGVTQG